MSAAGDKAEHRPSVVAVALAGAALTAIAPFLFDDKSSVLGVGIGALVATLNLWGFAVVIRGFLRGAGASFGALAVVKFGLLLLVLAIIVKERWAGPVPLAFGYAALPLGIVLGQLVRRAPTAQQG